MAKMFFWAVLTFFTGIANAGKDPSFINILHFNDAYNVYNAPRFAKKFMDQSGANMLRLFSGDIYSPAKETRFFKGEQFHKLFKAIQLHAAIPGNHEFDLFVQQFLKLQQTDQVPWILSNVAQNPESDYPFKDQSAELLDIVERTKIIELNGFKIGLFGTYDKDSFKGNLLSRTDLELQDFVKTSVKISNELRKQGCNLVIQLTHMENASDRSVLQAEGNEVDIIFGGHDHEFRIEVINNRLLVKSGFDFLDFSKSKIWFSKTPLDKTTNEADNYEFLLDNKQKSEQLSKFSFSFKKSESMYLNIEIDRFEVAENDEPDPELQKELDNVVDVKVKEAAQKVIYSVSKIEKSEEYKNRLFSFPIFRFQYDLLRTLKGSDIAMVNPSCFKIFKELDDEPTVSEISLNAMILYDEQLVILKISGDKIPQLLQENIDRKEKGAILIGITFNTVQENNDKEIVVKNSIKVNGNELDDSRTYTLITSYYFSSGREIATLKSCQKNKEVLSDVYHYDIVLKQMNLAHDKNTAEEYNCFVKVFPKLNSDSLIRHLQVEPKIPVQGDFCTAWKDFSTKNKDKASEELLKTLSRETVKRLFTYSMVKEVVVDEKLKQTYFQIDIDKAKVPLKIERKNII